MHIMPGVLGADKRISSSQGDGGPENRGELECLSLSLPAHPASRGSRLVNNLIFLLQLKYKGSKPPSKWKREEEWDEKRLGLGVMMEKEREKRADTNFAAAGLVS